MVVWFNSRHGRRREDKKGRGEEHKERRRKVVQAMKNDPFSVPVDAKAVDDEVEDALLHAAENATGGEGRRRSHLDDFIELVGYAAADGYLKEGKHYKLIRDGDVLRFNLSRAHPKIRKYHNDHDLTTSLFEGSEYRNRLKDKDDGYVEKVSQNTPPISRAVGIYLDEVAEVVDISASMFRDDEEGTPKKIVG